MHKLGITKFWGALVHILPFRLPKEIQGTVDAVGDATGVAYHGVTLLVC